MVYDMTRCRIERAKMTVYGDFGNEGKFPIWWEMWGSNFPRMLVIVVGHTDQDENATWTSRAEGAA